MAFYQMLVKLPFLRVDVSRYLFHSVGCEPHGSCRSYSALADVAWSAAALIKRVTAHAYSVLEVGWEHGLSLTTVSSGFETMPCSQWVLKYLLNK